MEKSTLEKKENFFWYFFESKKSIKGIVDLFEKKTKRVIRNKKEKRKNRARNTKKRIRKKRWIKLEA